MRLYTFSAGGRSRVGAERHGRLVDLQAAHAALPTEDLPAGSEAWFSSMMALIQGGKAALEAACMLLERIGGSPEATAGEGIVFAFDAVRLEAPLARPGKILCSGVNYMGHLTENPGAVLPETPGFFAKLPNTVIGPGVPIVHPRMTEQLD